MRVINWVLRFSRNAGATYGKGKDTYEAAVAVQEALTATPEVKAVVYAGHKTSAAQSSPARWCAALSPSFQYDQGVRG